jgi:hypothetical protein
MLESMLREEQAKLAAIESQPKIAVRYRLVRHPDTLPC